MAGLVAQGFSQKEIAEILGIPLKTASNRAFAASKRVGVNCRVGLTHWAIQNGLVAVGDYRGKQNEKKTTE